jgi:hypothetical protein
VGQTLQKAKKRVEDHFIKLGFRKMKKKDGSVEETSGGCELLTKTKLFPFLEKPSGKCTQILYGFACKCKRKHISIFSFCVSPSYVLTQCIHSCFISFLFHYFSNGIYYCDTSSTRHVEDSVHSRMSALMMHGVLSAFTTYSVTF